MTFIAIAIISCNVQKRNSEQTQIVKYQISNISDPFDMKIIYYIPAFECGTKAYASVCLGKASSKSDTIRVLSLCNTDSSLQVGQIIHVIPEEKPNFTVATGIILGEKDQLSSREFLTIYGKLVKN